MGTPLEQKRTIDGDASFTAGMISTGEPSQLTPGAYPRAMNVVNRGGVVQVRPGYRSLYKFPAGRLQGGKMFRPKVGTPTMLAAVDGVIYRGEAPFRSFRKVPGLQFASNARRVYFEQVEQSVALNNDGSEKLIDSRSLMVIQDGALTAPGIFDGSSGYHDRKNFHIPLGGAMKFVADRLWVARGPQVFGSDIADPITFSEAAYVNGASSFIFAGDVTALASLPSSDQPVLVVFTDETTSILQVGVRDRTQWLATPDFQKLILPKIGCRASRSVTEHFGMLWWWSAYGITSVDAAYSTHHSSKVPYLDAQMAWSKGRISDDVSDIAVGNFENYLLCSVPHSDVRNSHTWVMDMTPATLPTQDSSAVWNSFWTGTRPVEWITGVVDGVNRIFHLSVDDDGNNRLWEAFQPDRRDNGCDITWWMETRAYTAGVPSARKWFRFAELNVSELAETFDLAVFWAGGSRGHYKRILTKRIEANQKFFHRGMRISHSDRFFRLKKQTRVVRTQDAHDLEINEGHTSAGVESDQAEYIDKSFSLLIVGSGRGAISQLVAFFDPEAAQSVAAGAEVDETPERVVRFDGAAEKNESPEVAISALSDAADLVFTSNQTATFSSGGFTEFAVGSSESIISQDAATKVATQIARRSAADMLESVLPRIIGGIS